MENTQRPPEVAVPHPPNRLRFKDRIWLHVLLFVLTLVTTTIAGADMTGRFLLYEASDRWVILGPFRFNVEYVLDGLRFGGALLFFLLVHEFGHYLAARRHGVRTSLPFFIPFFPFNGIGTLGAVIRIRQQVPSLRKLFDIGAAGPLAGFVVAVGIVLYALFTLPPPTYVLDLAGHEALREWVSRSGTFPPGMLTDPSVSEGFTLVLGQTPLFWLLSQAFENVPPMWEMYHYPVLFAGWLSLFFTALNLLPVGQLDGGHILYALLGGKRHGFLARGFVLMLLVSGAIGFAVDMGSFTEGKVLYEALAWFGLAAILFGYLYRILDRNLARAGWSLVAIMAAVGTSMALGPMATRLGYSGWLVWCLLIVFVIRVDHPPVLYHEPLTRGRRWAAYASMVIFLMCFSLKPLYVV